MTLEIKITYPLRASISSFQSKTNNVWGRNFQQGQRPLSRIQGYGIEDEWGGHNRPPEPCTARTRPLVQRFIRQIMAISEIPRVNFVGQLSVGRRDQGVVYVDPKTTVLRSVASFRQYSQNDFKLTIYRRIVNRNKSCETAALKAGSEIICLSRGHIIFENLYEVSFIFVLRASMTFITEYDCKRQHIYRSIRLSISITLLLDT